MANPCFQFKQFTVWHDRCAMKVNTDGVLLGAWTPVENVHAILDIGTGSGIIALMLAQRCQKASIRGIEIEPDAYEQARENCSLSPWSQRIDMIHGDFRNFHKEHANLYDLIISNPPFFSQSLKNPAVKKQLARHDDHLSAGDLILGVKKLLHPNGHFAVILPFENKEIEAEAFIYGLFIQKTLAIRSTPDKPFSRKILFFAFRQPEEIIREELLIHDVNGSYSSDYMQLTYDFYLHFPKK
jgi:tRNA1Val (adenine37-N6)-methyltransferase